MQGDSCCIAEALQSHSFHGGGTARSCGRHKERAAREERPKSREETPKVGYDTLESDPGVPLNGAYGRIRGLLQLRPSGAHRICAIELRIRNKQLCNTHGLPMVEYAQLYQSGIRQDEACGPTASKAQVL
jgi:hypothetical protein